jgi:hypothetical protein
MAQSVAEGVAVTLVTCTAGEEGEIVAPDLEHLAADREDALGPHRLGELAAAMAALGVTDFLRLGGDFRFRDSGMAYGEDGRVIPDPHQRPNAFAAADLLDAADELVPVIRVRVHQHQPAVLHRLTPFHYLDMPRVPRRGTGHGATADPIAGPTSRGTSTCRMCTGSSPAVHLAEPQPPPAVPTV